MKNTNRKLTKLHGRYKIKCPFDQVAKWSLVTNQKHVFSSAGPMATKLDRMIVYDKGSPTNVHMNKK